MDKSANQLWRESGTSLSFSDWIQREKDKGISITNKLLEDVVAPFQNKENSSNEISKSSFGIPNWALAVGVGIISAAIFYKYYKK